MEKVYITGYRSFELGIFQDNDPKIKVIKNVLKKELQQLLEEGLQWVLFAGNLGVEFWAFEVALELKAEYPDFSIAVFLPFSGFGEQWNEKNQGALQKLKNQADYVNSVSHKPYENPQQLKNHTHFLLEHSDGSLIIYDEEYPGKTDYFYKDAQKYLEDQRKSADYQIIQITMDDLQYSQDFT